MKKLLRKLLPAVGLCLFALPANADYYLVGQPNGWTIDSSDYVLKETTSGSGIYEGTYYINGGAFQFRFYSALGNWDSNSIGAQSADSPVNITMTNGSYTGSYVSGKGSWQISSWAGGNVKMTIDTTTSKVTFEEVVGEKPIIDAPDVLYLIGNYEGGAFALNTGLEMQKSSDGQVFTLQNVVMTNSGSAYFAFTSALDSWDNINKTRIAPAIKDSAIELDEPNEFSYGVDASWSIPDGIYDFTVNFTEQAVYVTGSATAPDAMYLVGNFNDWTASDANYILTKQEDNTYVGTYNLPATIDGGTYNGETPIFKVYGLTWIGTSESTSTDSGGAGNLAVELTSGVEKVLPTSTSADAANWYLENWEGGDITFTYNYDDQTLTLLYVEPAPQAVYVLGEFNSWENNDDYKLEFSGDSIYEGEVYIPAGEEVAFRLFGNKSIGASEANYSITLNGEEELSYVVGSENNWVLKNWIGGTISFNITLEDGEPLVLDCTAPNMYLVGDNINGQGNWNTNFAGTFNDGVYTWNIDQLGTSFKISDDPTNWEGSYNIGAENDESTLNFGEAYTYFNNGNSKNINFSDARYHLNEATVTLNLLAGTLTVNGTQELNEITAVYVAGSFNEWDKAVGQEQYALTSNGNGVYTGELNLANTDQLKIVLMYGEVQAWYGASSSEASVEFDGVNPVNITLVDADNIVLGGFESGIVNFTVDTENMILTLLYEAPPVETVTIYAYNNAEWDDLYLYMYANDVPYDESWPGLAPTSSEEINGYSFNTYVIVKDENTPVNIIFNNNNNGSQVEYNGVITLDQDYYFEVNPNNVVLIEDPESFVPSDNTTPAPLTIYLLGDNVNGQSGWENPVAMTLEDDGTYTWTGTELGSKFKFNNGSWTDGYNIGAENEVNELELGVVFSLVNNENAQNILLAEDTYIENPSMVLDLENLTLTVTGTVVNTAPYVPGDVIYFMTSLDWTDGYELTKNEDGIYTGEIELIAPADSDIEFKLDCGNDKWYGAAAGQENVELVEGEATSLDLNGNGGNWTLTNWEEGTILVSVDWAAGVLTLEVQDSETDGIHSINASLNGDEAIYNLNGVRVDANKLTKGVYIINGKKVLVK